jgi:S1-C subfamily serine protease
MQVEAGSPADRAGLQQNDVIAAINGQAIDQDHPLVSVLFTHKPGETVTLTVLRNGQSSQIKLTLATHPTSQVPSGNSNG